ncbi:MAG: stage sporulation protein [Acidobacteriota bacterium]|nr:stage sporulation protein [Acidobacteriota bacterium]
MRRYILQATKSLLLSYLLVLSPLAFAQDGSQTRPRRAETSPTPTRPGSGASVSTALARLVSEPTIRIGLSTDSRAVSISSNGQLMNATGETSALVPLNVARVRLEARMLAPQPETSGTSFYRVEISGFSNRAGAESAARDVHEQTGESAEIAQDSTTNAWRLRVGANLSAAQAAALQEQLQDAGFANAAVVDSNARGSSIGGLATNPVRPVTRMGGPRREVVAYSAGSSTLFSTSAPVTFASDNEASSPVRLNDKPYRGRLEVFANPRGSLTVVNVLGLEDYVRGVVPNELSPGGYPAIEALKAQAVAARTYAIRNRNQFASQGFDLLPTTRSQVYGGLSTEHPLSTRAVDETRGVVATYNQQPINALYTSTCGGRTEDSENIFNEATPYLRGRECALEGRAHFTSFTVKTSREPPDIRDEANAPLARAAALLDIHDVELGIRRITDEWLAAPASQSEVRSWLSTVARLARQSPPGIADDITRAPGFSTALTAAIFGEARADTLLDNADVEYLLGFRDAGEIPPRNRPDVAWLVRDGILSLFPDTSLRPREPMSRARVLQTIARAVESRGYFGLQRGTTRPTAGGALILRSSKNRDQPITVTGDAYLFRAFGDSAYQMRSLALVGGEPVVFHLNSRGEVDYLEVRPAPNGAAADRSSPYANWTATLSVSEVQSRLSRWASGIGSLTDLRVSARGSSRRATDLSIIGTNGTGHIRGGRIRSALGLREQLFVIDRKYDEAGRLMGFVFTGRGWGHGVGMCQVGAYGLARQGLTYDRILKTYYTGIDLERLYN